MALHLIPLPKLPASFTVTLPDGDYRMRLQFNEAGEGCWNLDIGDAAGTPILCGVPILPGQDLLAQYGHLLIGGGVGLYCITPGNFDHVPGFDDLGVTSQIYYGSA